METTLQTRTGNVRLRATSSISVLHIIKSLGRGGAETLLPETLAQHNKGKFDFHYIYFLPWKNQMVDAIQKAGGTVTCFPAKNNLVIIGNAFKIAAYVRKHQIKLIHCHLPWAGIVGRLVGKLTGVPVVYTEHNSWERYHKFTYLLNKFSFFSQEQVIAVSADVANSIKKHYRGVKPQVDVVLNGINTDKFSPLSPIDRDIRRELSIPEQATVIGLACVFRKQKRVTVWLDIARQLHERFPNTHFIIAGDGPLKAEIDAKAKELGTEGFVHFVGLQPEIKPYLKAMDIFMMTSEFEGLPIALMEAMSMECMPACTSAGGIGELIKDNANGILVPVSTPMQLIERLSACLQAPSTIKVMGKAARETVVSRFGMKQMVSQIESLYDNLLNQKH